MPAAEARGGLSLPLGLTLDEAQRRYVAASIEHASANKIEAARVLGIGRNRIGRLLKSK